MKRRFFLVPPKHRLAQVSRRWILPISLPSGAKTCTPLKPSPAHPAADHTLASTSQRIPSDNPGDTCPHSGVGGSENGFGGEWHAGDCGCRMGLSSRLAIEALVTTTPALRQALGVLFKQRPIRRMT